jgi:adenine-specific DNA glycosylase
MRAALAALSNARELPTLQALRPRRHGFTHFMLDYTPYLARIDLLRPTVCEPRQRWVKLNEIAATPLPSPMRKLLDEVQQMLAPDGKRATSKRRAGADTA